MSVFRLNASGRATAKISREARIPGDVGSLDAINQLFWRTSASRGKPSAQQAVDGSGPYGQLSLSRGSVHPRRESAVQVPLSGETVRLGEEPGMQAGQIGRAKRRCFGDLRAVDSAGGEIGKALHGPVRVGHAAVDAQHLQ